MIEYDLRELGEKATISKAQYLAKAHKALNNMSKNLELGGLMFGLKPLFEPFINELAKELFDEKGKEIKNGESEN